MADVFVSYKKEDRALCERMVAALRAEGWSVWWDDDITPRETWDTEIERELNAAKAVVVLWTPRSVKSEWVRIEATEAKQQRKLVPFMVAPCSTPLAFRLTQTRDLVDWIASADVRLPKKARDWVAEFAGVPVKETVSATGTAQVDETPPPAWSPPPSPATAASPSVDELAWQEIQDSLELADYQEYEQHFPEGKFIQMARERRVQLDAWAQLDRSNADALHGFLTNPPSTLLPALQTQAEEAFEQAQRAAVEASQAAEQAKIEAFQKARAARAAVSSAVQAALTGRPVSERVYPLELPGVAGWPSPTMVVIPPGKFLMGSPSSEERWDRYDGREEPQHEVVIDYAFALGQGAVTFAAWDAYCAATGRDKPKDQGWGRVDRPVINVSWDDICAPKTGYLAWLNDMLGLTGRADAYRLPSEAEWEYACRAGTTTPFGFGATVSTDQANYDGNRTYGSGKKGVYRKKTVPVLEFAANDLGLHQMHGNVWEWCADCWNENYSGAPRDGSAWTTGDCNRRVLRGGSWGSVPRGLRAAGRDWVTPGFRNYYFGFRLARTIPR